jgi:hypothetical protein
VTKILNINRETSESNLVFTRRRVVFAEENMVLVKNRNRDIALMEITAGIGEEPSNNINEN